MKKPLYSIHDARNDIELYHRLEKSVGTGLSRSFKVTQGALETIGNYGDYRHFVYKSIISNPNMSISQKLEYLYLNNIIK